MVYRKLIVSGDNYELYEYEKEPFKKDDKLKGKDSIERLKDYISKRHWQLKQYEKEKGRDLTDYIQQQLEPLYEQLENLQNLKKEPKPDRSKERKQQTLRDARNTVKRYALANFSNNSYFMTLTVKENISDVVYMDKEFNNFKKRLKTAFGDNKYIGVREFQKRGAIHYHILIDIDFKLPPLPDGWDVIRSNGKLRNNSIAQKYDDDYIKPLEQKVAAIWKHGQIVDIKPIKHIDNVGAYLVKYMTKDIMVSALQGKKAYLNSQGLIKPKVINDQIEIEKIIREKLQKKEPTYKGDPYKSDYLGMINYFEYNEKRLNNQMKKDEKNTDEKKDL